MKKVILDTNALMAMAGFRIDLFDELEKTCDFPFKVYVLQGTLKELEKITREQRGRFQRAAKLARAILLAKKTGILEGEGNVDDLLVARSQAGDLVLTQDIRLKRKLKKPYLTIRQKRKVSIIR